MTDFTFSGSINEISGGKVSGVISIPNQPPIPPNPPNGGTIMPAYSYAQQYADTESAVPIDFKRTISPNQNSQWGSGLTIAPGPYPPGYKIANGQEGGGYPPQGQSSDGTLPIRLQPPSSGDGVRFCFYSTATCTVVNASTTQDGKFIWGLGVIYPSETDRPMMPFLGTFHSNNDYRLMAGITVPRNSAVQLTVIRMDVLDPDFADIPGWPKWKMVPNANGLYPAVGPTCVNPGVTPLVVKDVMAVSFAVSY
jgi:hypothetical protein